MTLLTEKGTFTKTTSTGVPVAQTITLANSSLTPKLVVFWTSAQTTSNGTYADDMNLSYGFSDGTNDACQAFRSDESAKDELYTIRNDSAICILSVANGDVLSRASITSFAAGQVNLQWDVQSDTTAMVIHYMVAGGTDITNVSVFNSTSQNFSTGNHSWNGSGTTFTPDFALIMTTPDSASVTVNTPVWAGDQSVFSLGAATSTTKQWVLIAREESVATSDNDMYLDLGNCIGSLNPTSGAISYLGTFVSFNSAAGGGITINITNAAGNTAQNAFLLVKGGKWDCNVFAQRSGTGTQNVTLTDATVTPKLVQVVGINSATEGTVVVNHYVGIGGADGTNEGNCYNGSTNALGTFVTARSTDTGKVYRNATPAATATSSTTNVECDMQSMSTAGQFTLDFTTADATLRQMAFWTVGETVSGTTFNRSPTAEDVTVADAALTRIITANRVPSTDSTTVADSSLTRMLSASRFATRTIYDDYNAGTFSFTEGGTSPNGLWDNMFLGGTGSSSGVRFASSIGSNVMWLKPQTSTAEFETHATENAANNTWGNFDATFRMRTVSQLRQNFPPNSWEAGWVIFRYTDDYHHYYFVLKTNGPELGRKDYSPPAEQQMFLATPGSPTLTLGQWYTVRIRAIRNHIQIWIDGSLVIDLVDDGSVGFDSQTSGLPPPPSAAMYSGSFNLYTEDAEVEFDDIWIGESDYVTVLDSSLTRSKTWVRLPSADTTIVSDVSTTQMISRARAPTAETIVVDENASRMTQAFRSPSSDTIVVDESLSGGKLLERIASTDSVTVADSSLTRLLSASRLPSTDSITTGENLTRILSAIRSPTADSVTAVDSSTTQSITRGRVPTADDISVADASLTRMLSATRVPTTEVTTIIDSSLTRIYSALRVPSLDSVVTSDNATAVIIQPGQFNRAPAAENVTVSDASLTRTLQLFRVPSSDTVNIVEDSLTRSITRIRAVSTDTVVVTAGTATRVRTIVRLPTTDTTTVSEASLTRLLQLFRVPSPDTTAVSENLTGGKIIARVPSADTVVVSAGTVTRALSLLRSPTEDTTGVIESSLVRLLSAIRSPSTDTVTVSELQSLISHSRVLQETITVAEPTLTRIVTAIRTVAPDNVEVAEQVFYQALHKFVFDSVIVAEQLFAEREQLGGSMSYATPAEVRPLLGNIGAQRTDPQINLAVDGAYDEINTKTHRIPPNDWKTTDHNFGVVQKLARFIAAKEMATGIKDFDIDALQSEIDRLWSILEYDTTSDVSQDIVGSSTDETYALNPSGIIWSTRYPNLKKGSKGEGDITINPDT